MAVCGDNFVIQPESESHLELNDNIGFYYTISSKSTIKSIDVIVSLGIGYLGLCVKQVAKQSSVIKSIKNRVFLDNIDEKSSSRVKGKGFSRLLSSFVSINSRSLDH